MTAGKILLRQVGAAGDQALFDVVVGDDFEQLVKLRHTQALADVGRKQLLAFASGKTVGALEFDGLDGEATGIGRCGRLGRLRLLAGQVLEFLQATALLFKQAILAFADQVRVAWRGGGVSQGQWRKAQQSQAQPRPKGG